MGGKGGAKAKLYYFFGILFGSMRKKRYFCTVITIQACMNRKFFLSLALAATLAVGANANATPMVMELGVAEQIDEQ